MRRKSSIGAAYFERLYARHRDPWKFETSRYERAKYDRTVAALPRERFENALEIGCANGVLTERLAERCERLTAVDVVAQVLERAKQRCADFPNVTIRKAQIPSEKIEGLFDLIVLSEVAYYWDDRDLAEAGNYFCKATAADGYLLSVHWTGETDYPKSGDGAVLGLWRATQGNFAVIRSRHYPKYRLDLWRRIKP